MGASPSAPIELTRVQRHGSAAFRCGVAEMQGWRGNHEDAHEIKCNDKTGQFWVLDGHGGDEAALAGAPALGEEFNTDLCKGDLIEDKVIEDGMIAVDKGLRARDNIEAGCTVIGAMAKLEEDGTYTVKMINAGDSRGILVRSHTEQENGSNAIITTRIPDHLKKLMADPVQVAKQNAPAPCKWPLVQESIDHKPNHPTEVARIEAAKGHVTDDDPPRLDGNLAVSRGLGDFEYKADPSLEAGKQKVSCVPDIYEAKGLASGSMLVLCCDGVYDVMTSDDVANLVHDEMKENPDKDLGEIAARIVRKSLDQNSGDNVTAMVVQLASGEKWTGSGKPHDEAKHYQKMLEKGQDEGVLLKYKSMSRKWKFPEEPVPCKVCGTWTIIMGWDPLQKAYFCSRSCQKKAWKKYTKKVEFVIGQK